MPVKSSTIDRQNSESLSPYAGKRQTSGEETANAIISNLYERKIVTKSEALLMKSAVSRNALALPISAKDVLRAAVFRNMLMQAFKNHEEEKRDDV